MRSVIFCPATIVETLPDKSGCAIISILDRSERAARPDLTQFHGALVLEFEDTSEESSSSACDFGDRPDGRTTAQYTQDKGEVLFSINHAHQILEFVEQRFLASRNESGADLSTLVVHCFAGISRSAAVAQFVADCYNIDLDTCKGTEGANPRVLRVLQRACLSRQKEKLPGFN